MNEYFKKTIEIPLAIYQGAVVGIILNFIYSIIKFLIIINN